MTVIKEHFVKCFAEKNSLLLETKINKYIKQQKGTVKIITVSYSSNPQAIFRAKAMVVFERTS